MHISPFRLLVRAFHPTTKRCRENKICLNVLQDCSKAEGHWTSKTWRKCIICTRI